MGTRIGIFGGTFDPPHLGHAVLAESARDQLVLDRVIWVPANVSPHKVNSSELTASEVRMQLVQLATHHNSAFFADDIELRRDPPSYTIDTLNLLKKRMPDEEFFLLMGQDSYSEFTSWKEHDVITQLAHLSVFGRRGGPEIKHSVPHTIINAPQLDISSTEIRHRVKQGKSIRYLVPDPVRAYILKNGLYRYSDATAN